MWLNPEDAVRVGRELLFAEDDEPVTIGEDAPGLRTHDQRIGDYRVLREIARGGMSTVYEAVESGTRRRVALKVIDGRHLSRRGRRWFQREVRVLGRLDHPGVARILRTGSLDSGEGGRPWFAMEFIQGLPVTQYADKLDLSVRDRLELLARICSAVQHAHGMGIVHRDLKPANILVVDPLGLDDLGQPKVLDFGIACATESDLQVTTLETDATLLIGTLPYMSPEQVNGEIDGVDARSDVYSLGVLAYELLSGRLPHDLCGKSVPDATLTIRDGDIPRLGDVDGALRGDVETIVHHALNKDRRERYQSAAELSADIRRYLRHEPILARPPGLLYRTTRFARRNALLVGALVVVFATLVGALSIVSVSLNRAIKAERDAHRQTSLAVSALGTILEFVDESWDLAGSVRGRQVAVDTTYAMLRDAYDQDPDNIDVLASLAAAIEQLGDLALENPGQHDAAELYREALAMRTHLVDSAPGNPDYRADLSIILVKVGDTHKEFDLHEALAWYVQAFELQQQLVRDHPENQLYADHLGWSHIRLCQIKWRLRDADGALAHAESALRIMSALETAYPGEADPLAGLYRSHHAIVTLSPAIGAERARPHVAAGIETAKELIAIEPDNRRFRWFLGQAYRVAVRFEARQGHLDVALQHWHDGVAQGRRLVADDPGVPLYRVDLLHHLLAMRHVKEGLASDERREIMDEAILHGEYLVELGAEVGAARRALREVYGFERDEALARGDADEAARCHARMVEQVRLRATRPDAVPDDYADLANTLIGMTDPANVSEAVTWAQRAIEAVPSPTFRNQMLYTGVLVRAGEWERAEAALERLKQLSPSWQEGSARSAIEQLETQIARAQSMDDS